MNVLLTGATGYVGGAIAQALQASGHEVMSLARTEAAAQRMMAAGIQPYTGDLRDPEGLRHLAQQADAVIHAAATNDAEMAAVDHLAVQTLAGALAGSQKPLLYTSGVWVLGNTGQAIANETWPLNPSPIVAWRPAIEQEVLATATQGVRAIVIRPALVYGHGGGLLSMLIQAGQQQGAIPVIDNGQNAWPFVQVDDLARLYVRAMEAAPAGSVFIGASGDVVSQWDVAQAATVAAGVGDRPQRLSLSEARQRWGALADALALDQRVSGDRAKHLLQWEPNAPSVLIDLIQGSYPLAVAA